MAINSCRNDPKAERLIKVLREDYSVEESELDGGQQIFNNDGKKIFNARTGAGDGCSTYTEALTPALRLATKQSMNDQNSSLLKHLSTEHGIKIPWIPSQKNGEIDKAGYRAITAEIKEIQKSIGIEKGSEGYNYTLAKKIFKHFMPSTESAYDPDTITWKLYAAMLLADLNVSFSLIPMDLMGRSTPLHMAIEIKTSGDQSVIADPSYAIFDMICMPPVRIDESQALSIHYTQQALKERHPIPFLGKALQVDPYNSEAQILGWHASPDVEHPLSVQWAIRCENRKNMKENIKP